MILSLDQDNNTDMRKTDGTEKKVAQLIQKDIDIVSRPFEKLAQSLSITQSELIQTINNMISRGLIRKFGAILVHQKAGFKKNAMIVWSVPPKLLEKTGEIFSSFPFVSHCYERKPRFKHKYNLFTMIHSQNENIASLTRIMSKATGVDDFLILESRQEYKKTSPEYF